MKKVIIVLLVFGLSFPSFGQKNVLLEKFTNIYCGNCPDASILLASLEEEYPNLIWISHYSYSVFEYNPMVYPGGDQMWEDLTVSGTPLGIVDRSPYNNALVHNRANWESQIQQQQDLEDYVDIELDNVNFNSSNRELTFDVSCQFHTLPTDASNLNVILYVTEDDVIWRQKNYFNETPGHPLEGLGVYIQDYSHQNVLRNLLSGGFGDESMIPDNPILGEAYVKTFSYTVPAMYNHLNLELTAAVSKDNNMSFTNRPVLNAERIQVQDFVINSTNESAIAKFYAFPNPSDDVINLQFKEIPTKLTLEHLNGTQIKQYTVEGLNMLIDLGDLPSGQYILQVVNGDQSVARQIIIH